MWGVVCGGVGEISRPENTGGDRNIKGMGSTYPRGQLSQCPREDTPPPKYSFVFICRLNVRVLLSPSELSGA